MPDVTSARDFAKCPRCKALMTLDVYIAPVGKTEGMAVYRCAKCDGLDSRFVPLGAPASRAR